MAGEIVRGDNLLISYFDNRTHTDAYGDFVSVVHIRERHSYTPVDEGYSETIVIQGDRQRLLVQVNNPHVQEDTAAGILDVSGLLVVDQVQRVISDCRAPEIVGIGGE